MIGNKIVEGGNLVRFLLKIGVVCENYIVGFSFSFIKKMEGFRIFVRYVVSVSVRRFVDFIFCSILVVVFCLS